MFPMRLAWFSPLPPSKTGIADYCAELLPYVARGADVSVFVEHPGDLRANRGRDDYRVYDVVHFNEIHAQQPFDLCIYHSGNNPYHEFIYERALAVPGLLAMHENCFHHLIAWKTLGRDHLEEYRDEMLYAYGRTGARLADIRFADIGSEYQQFITPLGRRIIERSLGVIVHNQYAADTMELPADGSAIPVTVIPHHLAPQTYQLDEMDAAECRERLGLPADRWIVGSLGFVTPVKRLHIVLKAFQKLAAIMPQALLLIVGEDHKRHSIAPLIDELGLRENVHITGYTKEEDFFRYLKAVDVVVNLRYPTGAETSGTLIRSLGAGKPVIVSDFGQFGDLPDDVCLKVALNEDESREVRDLYMQLRKLANRPLLRQRLGERALRWTRTECEISRCAARYLEFAEQLIASPQRREHLQQRINSYFFTDPLSKALSQRIVENESDELPAIEAEAEEAIRYIAGFFADDPNASSYLRTHSQRTLETLALIPHSSGRERLLELSSYLHLPPLLMRYGGYREIEVTNWWQGEPREKQMRIRHAETGEEFSFLMKNVDVERQRFPWPDQHFDIAVCGELIEHLTEDPMQMLIELHRILKWGGLVVITTPNIASALSLGKALAGNSPYVYGAYNLKSPADRHSREYTPNDIQTVMEAAGFKVEKLYTKDLWCQTNEPFLDWLTRHSPLPREMRGENIFALGRKASEIINRYPDGIYD